LDALIEWIPGIGDALATFASMQGIPAELGERTKMLIGSRCVTSHPDILRSDAFFIDGVCVAEATYLPFRIQEEMPM